MRSLQILLTNTNIPSKRLLVVNGNRTEMELSANRVANAIGSLWSLQLDGNVSGETTSTMSPSGPLFFEMKWNNNQNVLRNASRSKKFSHPYYHERVCTNFTRGILVRYVPVIHHSYLGVPSGLRGASIRSFRSLFLSWHHAYATADSGLDSWLDLWSMSVAQDNGDALNLVSIGVATLSSHIKAASIDTWIRSVKQVRVCDNRHESFFAFRRVRHVQQFDFRPGNFRITITSSRTT